MFVGIGQASAAAAPCSTAGGGAGICYVDTASSGGNGTTQAITGANAAFATIAAVNGYTYAAGDQILFKRGDTWSEQLTPSSSGSAGNPIIFGMYGVGQNPIIAGGTYSISVTSKQYLQFNHLILKNGVYIMTSNEVTLNYCVVYGSVTNWGTYANNSTNYRINNSVIASNYQAGIWGNGVTTTIYLNNSIVIGNGMNGQSGLKITSGATINYDHNLITGNSYFPRLNIGSDATIIDQGNNLKEYSPGIISPKVDSAYFVITSDDADYSYWQDLSDALASYDVHFTPFVNAAGSPTGANLTAFQYLLSEGQEMGNHTWGHSNMSSITAFSITSTNTNPTVNVDTASSKLIFNCDQVGNRVTVDWSAADKTITDVKAAVAGKGWTITTLSGSDGLRMTSLVDSSGVQTVPYTVNLDISAPNYAFFREEISDENDAIFNVTGYRPITMSYPYGTSTAELWTYLKDILGLTGAAGVETTSSKNLASINIFNAWRVGLDAVDWGLGSGTEEDIRNDARHVYSFAKEQGIFYSVLSHNAGQFSVGQMIWFVDELIKAGATFKTFGEAITEIKTTHSTTDGLTYTKTYPDLANYNLNSISSCVDSGTGVGLVIDSLGNSIYGLPDIGAYEYQPPYTFALHNIPTTGSTRLYSDGKYRMTTASTTNTIANFSIAPSDGYLATTTQYMDLTITTWDTTGDKNKQWTATSAEGAFQTHATSTVYTIGDLIPNSSYQFKLDGTASTTAVTNSAQCASGVCTADSSGAITFTYTGGYSTHTFALTRITSGSAQKGTITVSTLVTNDNGGTKTSADFPLFVNSTPVVSGIATSFLAPANAYTVSATPNPSYTQTFSGDCDSDGRISLSPGDFKTCTITMNDSAPVSASSGSPSASTASAPATSTTSPIADEGLRGASGLTATQISSILSILSSFGADTDTIASVQSALSQPSPKATAGEAGQAFSRDLKLNSTGSDVQTLQQFLNSHGFPVANTGPGSEGNETETFGLLTQSALIRFQKANGIVPAVGYFGPITREKIGMGK